VGEEIEPPRAGFHHVTFPTYARDWGASPRFSPGSSIGRASKVVKLFQYPGTCWIGALSKMEVRVFPGGLKGGDGDEDSCDLGDIPGASDSVSMRDRRRNRPIWEANWRATRRHSTD
jgi:hypothetical protein